MHKKSLGLPGGPNQYVTDISEFISIEGYKRDSPDVNNPYNIIPSGNITMEGVDFAVKGRDNLGNELIMEPGGNYQFPGDSVLETRLAQNGIEVPSMKRGGGLLNKTMKCNSCSWEWKAADGGSDIDTCHKCGSKALPKAQDGIEETINNYLGNPYVEAREFAENPDRTRGSGAYNIDNMRHAQASRLVQEAIANKTGNIPFISNALGFLGSNALGVGHELKTLLNPIYDRDLSTELQESGEDIFNNFFGSVVGTLPIDDKTKDYIIKYASNNNMLPDGFAKDKKQEVLDGFSGNKYFKDKEGNIKKPEYKRGGNVLPKAQTGGQIKLSTTYKNYILGDDNTEEAEKTYDKLNRIYYKQSKEAGMSPANFIMTHVIGNS